jgi:hypothetical protein
MTNSADDEEHMLMSYFNKVKVSENMFVYISVPCRTYEELWNKSLTLLMKAGIQNIVPKTSPSSHLFTYLKYCGI